MSEAQSSEAGDRQLPHNRHYSLALLFLIMALSVADRSLINVAIPGIKEEFGLSDGQLGFLAGLAFSLVHVALALPVALLADRTSRTMVLTASLALWSLVTTATAFCSGFVQLMIARLTLGAAEAGNAPPAQSIIADLYPPSERPFALSIYSAGQGLGGFLGMAIGGVIIGIYGDWRAAFFAFGLAGMVLAVVFRLTLREPPRGLSEEPGGALTGIGRATLGEAIGLCLSRPSFLHVVAGNGLNGLAMIGVTTWMPTFLIRSHGMTIAEAGLLLAPIMLTASTLSQLGGGWLAGRLGRRDASLTLSVPAAIGAIGVPIYVASLLVEQSWLCLSLYFLASLTIAPFTGAVDATVQGIAGRHQRTIAAALFLTIVTLIGTAGPWLSGLMSDGLQEIYGNDSLRMAMAALLCLRFWSAAHFFLASRHLAGDFARRPI